MPEDQRQLWIGQLSVDNVEVGAADRADFDSNPLLSFPRPRRGDVRELERLAWVAEEHGAHECQRSARVKKIYGL